MEEKDTKVDNQVKTPEEIREAIAALDSIFSDEKSKSAMQSITDLSLSDDLFLDDEPENKPVPYTTDLIENIQKLEPTLTVDQIEQLIQYVKGAQRPDFMDKMLTQNNDKLIESMKLMTVLQLLRLPALYDYLNALQKNMLDKDSIGKMTFEDISKTSVNIQKEITDILNLGLSVATKLSNVNTVPTKVEKLANALMGVSDATRQRIEEIIAMDS